MATLAPRRPAAPIDYFSCSKKKTKPQQQEPQQPQPQEVNWLPEALYAGYAASPQALPTSLSIPDCFDGLYDSESPSTSPSLSQDDTLSISSLIWDSSDSAPPLTRNSSKSTSITSPTSPFASDNTYTLDNQNFTDADRKVDQALNNFGSFDDWLPWDNEATQLSLSPSIDAPSPDVSNIHLNSPAVKVEEAATFQDTVMDEPLFPTTDLPPREGLYSTPLSWERPRVGDVQQQKPIFNTNGFTPLTAAEEAKLRNIAMPHSHHASSSSSPSMSPEPSQGSGSRKRKSTVTENNTDGADAPRARGPPVKKTAHNMIEKRYRTNLNEKIAALRDSVPSLRNAVRGGAGEEADEEDEDLDGLTPAHKLNKATILSKATEYIAHLEKRNKNLLKENATLKARVEAFEILMSRGSAAQQQQQSQQQRMNAAYGIDNRVRTQQQQPSQAQHRQHGYGRM